MPCARATLLTAAVCALSAYDVLSSNLRLCVEYCKKLSRPGQVASLEGGKAIAITLPDVEELRRTMEYLGDAEPWPNVRLNSLGGDSAADRNPLEGLWSNVFKQSGGGDAVVADWAGMYVLLGASCQELPTIRKLHELQPNKPIICFNLKLDTLRGDLGLPAFPPRSVHHDFLYKYAPARPGLRRPGLRPHAGEGVGGTSGRMEGAGAGGGWAAWHTQWHTQPQGHTLLGSRRRTSPAVA